MLPQCPPGVAGGRGWAGAQPRNRRADSCPLDAGAVALLQGYFGLSVAFACGFVPGGSLPPGGLPGGQGFCCGKRRGSIPSNFLGFLPFRNSRISANCSLFADEFSDSITFLHHDSLIFRPQYHRQWTLSSRVPSAHCRNTEGCKNTNIPTLSLQRQIRQIRPAPYDIHQAR